MNDSNSEKIGPNISPDAGPLATTNSFGPSIEPGAVIAGRYKLLQPLGEGGMGTVYVAEQEQPVKRRVALKLIKPGMDSAQVLRRFEAERQALALMDHTHIAKVLDAGTTPEGRPFFVMELVKGVPITKYCDELHLSLRDRLELFVPVCQAIQHAHQKGIIHRDIKPSNVLVAMQDGKPVPKVIDFGVAKALHQKLAEGSMFTEIGQIVGTLEYMSPEQAELTALDIDTRTDVYALGVLLYELLTGSTPLDRKRLKQAAYVEMLRMIRKVEPPKPSTRLSESKDSLAGLAAQRRTEPARLTKAMRGELDWIVMKALEKDRTRRYETANGLARDIERHLHDEPVEACPPSTTYRLRKLLRKHKGLVSAAMLVLLTLLGGIVGTTWGLVRAENALQAEAKQRTIAEEKQRESVTAAERERLAKERESEQRRLAEERKELAEASEKNAIAKKQIADAVLTFLQRDLLKQADPNEQADAARRLGGAFEATENPTIRELLERAALELTPENIEARFPGQREVQASILQTVGGAYRGIGDYEKSLEFLSRSSDSYRDALGADHADTLNSLINVASTYEHAGELTKSIDLLEHLRDRFASTPVADERLNLVALNVLGWAYQSAGRFSEAIEIFEWVRDIRIKELGAEHPDTLSTLNNLALTYRRVGRHSEAIEILLKVYEAYVKLSGADHPKALSAKSNLADVYRAAGEPVRAIDLLEQVRDVEIKKLGADHPEALMTQGNLAQAYLAAGKLAEATQLLERLRDAFVKKLGEEHPLTLVNLLTLATAYRNAQRLPEAIELLQHVREAQVRKLGADHPEIFVTFNNLALAYLAAGKLPEAIELFEQARDGHAKRLGADHPDTLTVRDNLASTYWQAGKLPEAIELLEQVRVARIAKFGPDHVDTLTTLNNLAGAYRAAGRLAESIVIIEQVRQAFVKKLGPDHPDSLTLGFNLAASYQSVGKVTEAIELFEQIREARTRTLGPEDPYTFSTLNALGQAYQAAGKPEQAIPLFEQAVLGFEKLNFQHEFAAKPVGNLIAWLEQASRHAEAENWRRKWLAVVKERVGPEHPAYAGELAALGSNLLRQEKWTDAEPVLRECHAIREKLAAVGNPAVLPWQVANVKSMLGGALAGQGNFAEAEPLLSAGYEGLKTDEAAIPPQGRSNMVSALERLEKFYTATGQPEKAIEWRQELDEFKAAEKKPKPALPKNH